MGHIAIFIPIFALSIPVIAIVLGYRLKAQKNQIREMELKKEILELEIVNQNSKVLLLEEENKKLDRIINGN
jgi:TolA-binding protein